jgi:uncharacterized membrane protein
VYGAAVPEQPPVRPELSPWPFAGIIGLACVAFLIGATTVAVGAPWWAITGLVLVWLVALVLAISWFSSRPRTVAAIPFVVALIWFATVVGGARFLDWS